MRKTTTIPTMLLTVIVLFIPLIVCRADTKPHIAIILPETGKYSALGDVMKESILLAVDKKFKKLKRSIELEYFDNYSNPDTAISITERIASDQKYIGIIGGFPSSCAYQTMIIAERTQIPYLVISSSADSLTNLELEYTFRMAPLSSEYNDGLVSWVATNVRRGRLISVIHDSETSSMAAVVDIRVDLKKRWRGKTDFFEISRGQSDFGELIDKQRKLKPDLIWLICSPSDAAHFLKQCRQNEWSPMAFVFGSVNMANNRIISLADGAADYVLAPAVWSTDEPYPGIIKFTESYLDKTGELPDYHAAEAYAGIEVLASALRNCETFNRKNLREKFAITNILSVFGKVRFDDFRGFRNQNRSRSVCVQLLDNQWQTVWPRELAGSRYTYPPPDWRERNRLKKFNNTSPLLYVTFTVLTVILLIMTFKRGKDLKRKIGL